MPEKRKIRYLLVDAEAMKAKVVVPPGDIERQYQQNNEQYSTPEQVRASHILLNTEGKDEAAVKAQAESLLKQVRAGGDFAALATKYSQDEASAKNGGDLDYFGRGRMVKEFEDVAFSLAPGSISDLVKTQYRLPHHQGGRQEARHDQAARGGAPADRRPARLRACAGAGDGAGDDARARHQAAGGPRHRGEGPRPARCRSRRSSPRRSRSAASVRRRRSRPRRSR